MLLGIGHLGTTFGGGLSNHQAATAQMHLVGETNIVECRPILGALPLSPTMGRSWSEDRLHGITAPSRVRAGVLRRIGVERIRYSIRKLEVMAMDL